MGYGDYNVISEKQILLENYQNVLKNFNNEMRGGYSNSVVNGNNIINEYVPDSRAVLSESVEGLAYSLYPYFDKDMKEAFEKYEKSIEKLYKDYGKDGVILDETNNSYFSIKRLKVSKKLFKELSELLYRLGYLKSKSYEQLLEEDNGDEEY